MPETIEIWGRLNGCYFPIILLSVDALRERGYDGEFMLRWPGQMSQFNESPSGCLSITPQDDSPVHDLNAGGAGIPDFSRSAVENVTVFFATGHSNVVSGIATS